MGNIELAEPSTTELSRLHLFGSRVLVKAEEVRERTKGGLYIPDTSKVPAHRGVVVAVGDGCAATRVGDVVLVGQWGAVHLLLDGTEYRVYFEKDIIGKLAPDAYRR